MRNPLPEPQNAPTAATASVPRSVRKQSPFDWMFRNRQTGRITIAQFPNVPLGVFLVTVVTRSFVPTGTAVRTAVDWMAIAALAWWAIEELVRGVNPWRRLLGVAGLAFAVAGLLSRVR